MIIAYSASSGELARPWIIHRAPLGSHERFVALLLEYFDGQLPGWLSPIQVMLLPVSDRESEACQSLHQKFMKAGIRAKVDESQGSLSKRILFAHRYRPFAKLIIGPREISSGVLRIEFRDGKIEGEIGDIINRLKEACAVP